MNITKNTTIKISLLAFALTTANLIFPLSTTHADPSGGSCQDLQLSVALSAGQSANQTLAATLCQPSQWAEGTHQIDVLVHGGTYNKMYWDWPTNSPQYSYVSKTLSAGRATLAFDQIGAGASSKPLSALVTIQTAAYTTHQVVQWARTSGFSVVNLIGHSVGSFTAIREAGTYQDIDRLVITGALHAPGLGAGLLMGPLKLYPAALDSQFAGQSLDLGYLTTQPTTRGSLFYSGSADPAVVAYDDTHKDIFSSVQLATTVTDLTALPSLNISNHITAPVLLVIGQQDTLFCGLAVSCTSGASIVANEQPYYSSAANLTASAITDTGHNLALHPSKDTSFQVINQWLQSH